MGQFLTKKYLKYRDAMSGAPVSGDQSCDQCSYNLRGLRYGGACPECGTPITLRGDGDLPFHEMPLPVIRKFRVSSWIATLSIFGFIALLIFAGQLTSSQVPVGLLMLVMLALWLFAIWRLTPILDLPQAARYGFSPTSKLRFAARWFQLGWALTVIDVYFLNAGVRSGFLWYVSLICFIGGFVVGLSGIASLCMFLGRFSDWVGDEFAEKAFRLTIWGNVIAIPLALIFPKSVFGFGYFMIVIGALFVLPIALLLIASLLAFPVGLLSLSRSVDWSIVHSRQRAARERALREKMAPRPAPLPETPEQIGLSDLPTNDKQIHPLSASDPSAKENS